MASERTDSTGDASSRPSRVRISLSSSGGVRPGDPGSDSVTCHVCKCVGHRAGFQGAVYVDCLNFACYLCKRLGHTTMTCPYRILPSAAPAAARSRSPARCGRGSSGSESVLRVLAGRSGTGGGVGRSTRPHDAMLRQYCAAAWRRKVYRSNTHAWRIVASAAGVHNRRVSVAAFHPRPAGIIRAAGSGETRPEVLLFSADKSGQIGVWRVGARPSMDSDDQASPVSVYAGHRWLVNALVWDSVHDDKFYTGSADGTVRIQYPERRAFDQLCDANLGAAFDPENEAAWRMMYALTTSPCGGSAAAVPLIAGDDVGRFWAVDSRCRRNALGSLQAHARGNKVMSLHMHPSGAPLMVSAGNDWFVHLWDVRKLQWGVATEAPRATPLSSVRHPRVVNSAVFSPITGNALLTTCIDNRLRVFPNVHKMDAGCEPDSGGGVIEIVHSQDFGRYLTPFRAVWDPKDISEQTLLVGRYISEAFEGVPLHPIDVISLADVKRTPSGVVCQMADPSLLTISPVVAVHPSLNLVACGSSKSLYVWAPVRQSQQQRRADDPDAPSTSADDESETSSSDEDDFAPSHPAPRKAARTSVRATATSEAGGRPARRGRGRGKSSRGM